MRTVHFFATYYEQEHTAMTLINSLLLQTADNWKLTICSNADKSVLNLDVSDPRVEIQLKKENSGFWGALNRKSFIENELKDDELLINTSCEDYYVKTLVEEINKRDEDFIMWDSAHHHFKYSTIAAMVQPRRNKIDWGSYAILGSCAKKVVMADITKTDPETGQETKHDPWLEFTADGIFVEYTLLQQKDLKTIRLPKILFVKN